MIFGLFETSGPAVTHDHDSMVERFWIFLQTLDPDPIAPWIYTRLEVEGSV
jgi:hypothetical protein